ncbi:resolvase [Actinokineospora spheciospongiae]|uniref:resolvase n=1 Tax=Actinokineospora spheciospongiae TaxID=909613 RepID=UPI001F372642|nr:resolvase [Actinokineospora spheciospongiae]
MAVLRRINDPSDDAQETVTTIQGRTALPRRTLTEREIADLIVAYRAGVTAPQLAARLGVHTSTIKKKLLKFGVRRNGEHLLRGMQAEGKS